MKTGPRNHVAPLMYRAADAKARAYYWLRVFHASENTDLDAKSRYDQAEAEYAELEPQMFVEACERMSKSPETSESWDSPGSLSSEQRLMVFAALGNDVADILTERLHAAMSQPPVQP